MLTYLMERNLLVVSGFLKSNRTLMTLLNDTNHNLWSKVIMRNMTLIIKKHLLQVAQMTSVRSLLAIAATKQWPLLQMDVKNVFLSGTICEEVYMKPPPGTTLPP